jgi:hypothetical protein
MPFGSIMLSSPSAIVPVCGALCFQYFQHLAQLTFEPVRIPGTVLGHTVIDAECPPYSVWSDNGGEFAGEFRDEMLRWRIVHKHTEPYNPEQNGKIERW